MRRICILAVAAVLAAALVGCAPGTGPENPGGVSEPGGSSGQAVSEGPEHAVEASSASDSESSRSPESPRKAGGTDYVLADSDKVIYSAAELEGLSDDELFLARNELFARHGAVFADEELRGHFATKAWYREIEPKLDEYGAEVLNLVESTNASTLRRVELERGSKHVNPLDPERAAMYGSYLSKAEEYRKCYGECGLLNKDGHDGLTGLCLTQLVDFDGDGWEELLLAFHDGSNVSDGDFFAPGAYRVEVWSYRNGALEQVERREAESTQATSSYLMLCRAGGGYEFGSSKSLDGGLVYYYKLSQSNSPSAGDQYWFNNSDLSFSFDQVQTITSETLATLGAESPSSQGLKLRDGGPQILVGRVALVEGDVGESPQPRLWAALELDSPATYDSKEAGEIQLDRLQIGPVATDGAGQPAWEPYEGQRVAIVGNLEGATWNLWHLTPCTLEGAEVVGAGEGRRSDHRDGVAKAFATAIRTNYRIEDGEYVHDRPDCKQYVSPTSELYEFHDGNDEGEGVLVLGNPSRVESAEVADAIGDTFIVDMTVCWPKGSLEDEDSEQLTLAVVFNDDDLVEHAYFL